MNAGNGISRRCFQLERSSHRPEGVKGGLSAAESGIAHFG